MDPRQSKDFPDLLLRQRHAKTTLVAEANDPQPHQQFQQEMCYPLGADRWPVPIKRSAYIAASQENSQRIAVPIRGYDEDLFTKIVTDENHHKLVLIGANTHDPAICAFGGANGYISI